MIEKNNTFKDLGDEENNKISQAEPNQENSFFIQNDLKSHKDAVLHRRFEDTIYRCGISKREFYERSGLSPAYYWRLSWGIDKIPTWIKTKLCNEFGKPFIDFFLIIENEVQNGY